MKQVYRIQIRTRYVLETYEYEADSARAAISKAMASFKRAHGDDFTRFTVEAQPAVKYK